MTQLPGDRPTMFESATCGRCGGGGHYSYNMMHGSMCYGCGGRGRKLTKRGTAAQAYYRELLSKRTDELAPGDIANIAPNPIFGGGGWMTITAAAPNPDGTYNIDAEPLKAGGMRTGHGNAAPDRLWRLQATAEQKAAAKAKALELQASLTKQGKPRKRKAAA